MIKKLLCLMLALLMVMTALIACADDSDKPGNDDNSDQENSGDVPGKEDPWLDDLPEKDLGDINIVFAYFFKNGINKDGCSINAEANNGDMINDTMYNRNAAISERFSVNLIGEQISEAGGIIDQVRPALTAGSTDYDVLVGYQYYDISLAVSGLMYNFNDLQQNYLNIENEWWSTDYINNINYSDHLYWLTGDVTLAHIGTIVASYINTRIYEERVKEEFGNIYDLVREKEWTFEVMIEMAEMAYVDTTGDDKFNEGDQYGFLNSLGVEMAYCSGINSSRREDDGNIVIAIDDESTADIMWFLNEIGEAKFSASNNTEQGQYQIFARGDAMIYFRDFMAAEDPLFRSMEDDFYIVPLPMGDPEVCDDYRSTCMTGNNIIGMAHTTLYPEETALVLEALAAESYKSVTPVYYDTILKDRYTRDNDSKEMIDMIREKVGVDFVNTWSFGYTDVYGFYLDFNSNTVASRIETYAPKWRTVLEELLAELDELP